MTKKQALKLAIKVIKRWAVEYYGFEAKFHEDKRKKWDELMQVVHILQDMMEDKNV